jgi:hypothetical protein
MVIRRLYTCPTAQDTAINWPRSTPHFWIQTQISCLSCCWLCLYIIYIYNTYSQNKSTICWVLYPVYLFVGLYIASVIHSRRNPLSIPLDIPEMRLKDPGIPWPCFVADVLPSPDGQCLDLTGFYGDSHGFFYGDLMGFMVGCYGDLMGNFMEFHGT